MSHDRGCAKCGADGMSEYRDCFGRIGEACFKSQLVRRASGAEGVVVTNTPRAGETAEQTAARTAPRGGARSRLIEADSATRKTFPMCTGLLDYFPDALAEVAKVSFLGNAKHNPGEPMHHARGKSMDHPDCIARHLVERGGFDVVAIDGVEHRIRHSGALAWRALALLQEEIEREQGLPLPRGARTDAPPAPPPTVDHRRGI